jgi:hypothetical protein
LSAALLQRLPLRRLRMRRRAVEVMARRTTGAQAADYLAHCHDLGLWIRGHGWAHVAALLAAHPKAPEGFLADLLAITAAAAGAGPDAAAKGQAPAVKAAVERLLDRKRTPLGAYLAEARLALEAADVMKEVAVMLFPADDGVPAEEPAHA